MTTYIALLRGINISGKNKISMSDLKSELKSLGFNDVKTYLNSGNILFSCNEENIKILSDQIKEMILLRFALEIPVYVITLKEVQDILEHAPEWWGTSNADLYDNLIFVMEKTAEEIAEKIGEPTKALEQVCIYKNVIFWTFDRKKYAKANWWKKTASAGIGEFLTIRTVSTIRKLV